jgi:hypothetical protein
VTWFKVDDSFHSHPKVLAADAAALGLWVVAGAWCSANLTDGFVPDYVLQRLLPDSARLAEQLITCRLWKRTKGGYRFHDWLTYQPTKEEATAAKEKKSSGGALGNHRRWHTEPGKQNAHCPFCQGKQSSDNRSDTDRSSDTGTESHPIPPVPDPTRPDKEQTQQPSVVETRKRGTRIPDDFHVTEDMVAWARDRVPHVDGRTETEKFVNFWRAKTGKDATKLDWPATWRNWMLNAKSSTPLRALPGRQNGGGFDFEREMARALDREAAAS